MRRRMLAYSVFYGLGAGSAVFAVALLLPLLHSGSPLALEATGATRATTDDGLGACPYLAQGGATPHSAIAGQGSGSVCPYLSGRSSRCPYLREQARRQEGSTLAPPHPRFRGPHAEDWFRRTPRQRTVALRRVEASDQLELTSVARF